MSPMPGRDVLPVPDRDDEGLVTFGVNDPDTSFPPIEQVTPPEVLAQGLADPYS